MATRVAFPNEEFQRLLLPWGQRLDPEGMRTLCLLCGHPAHTLTAEALWPAMAIAILERAVLDLWLGELLHAVIQSPDYGAPLIEACKTALLAWEKAEAQAAPYAPTDPKSALILFNDAPFVDRVDQRPHVQGLVQRLGRRVLIVRGDPATGKTHTALFVRHLVEQNPGAVQMAPIRLQEVIAEDGERVTATDLMRAIANRLHLSTEDARWDAMAQDARKAEKLTLWLEEQTALLRTRNESWLLVMDSLNHPRVGSGALELVDRLIISGSRGDLVNVGLILLALPTPPPAHVANDVLDITLPPLTETDFRTHVTELARLMQRELAPTGAAVMLDYVLKGLSFPLGHDGMDLAGQRLRELPALIARA